MTHFPRPLLSPEAESATVPALQSCLVDLIDLSLQLKQAHWNLLGRLFQPVHELLDDIVDTARSAGDEVAERIVAIGTAADGRTETLASASRLTTFPAGFHPVAVVVTNCADRVATTVAGLRASIEVLGDTDPISEDLLIGITADLEKHLWMLQAQEAD